MCQVQVFQAAADSECGDPLLRGAVVDPPAHGGVRLQPVPQGTTQGNHLGGRWQLYQG